MHLIVTSKRDLTSDFIILELQRRGLPYFRLNTEDIPKAVFRCVPGDPGAWQFDLPNASFDLSRVNAAYFRRPGMPEALLEISEGERSYSALEWYATLQSLYWAVGERWLNPPHLIALAENKIYQLTLARALGFLIPDTLVSNDPIAAREFASKGEIIGKPLRNSVVKGLELDRVVFTTRVSINEQTDPLSIRACPMILQREIRKQFDVRVTVVGDQVFAATIDSQSDSATEVDWRRTSKPDLAHAVYHLPEDVADQCIALTQKMGLRFGAVDFVLDRDDQLWFLEINPNGQWGWIETRTGQPIAAAIVSEMERIADETMA